MNLPGGWVGIGDIHHVGDGKYIVLERDNQGGLDASIKKIYSIFIGDYHDSGSVLTKTLVRDILPDVSTKIGGTFDPSLFNVRSSVLTLVLHPSTALALEKVEGLTVSGGNVWITTDNDGVDDNSGETQLQNLGRMDFIM